MRVPEAAQQLRQEINEASEAVDSGLELAREPELQSEAVQSALQEAKKQLRIADEQLGNVVAGS